MWLSWVVANRRDPGYLPFNSETYHRAIKQIPFFDKWKKRNMVNKFITYFIQDYILYKEGRYIY